MGIVNFTSRWLCCGNQKVLHLIEQRTNEQFKIYRALDRVLVHFLIHWFSLNFHKINKIRNNWKWNTRENCNISDISSIRLNYFDEDGEEEEKTPFVTFLRKFHCIDVAPLCVVVANGIRSKYCESTSWINMASGLNHGRRAVAS